jgi:hypothetical protein
MDTPPDEIDIRGITVLAATRLEAAAVRRAAPGARLIEAGIGLSRLTRPGAAPLGETVVTCGLAGGVRPGLRTGAVVIPARVRRPDGGWLVCDPFLVDVFTAAARALGYEAEHGALGTPPAMVHGAARAQWAARGCAAVDMETGLVAAPRLAAVRVVLDTAERELSPLWGRPARALFRPGVWREAAWLWREAPRCAGRAAAVLAAGLASAARPRAGARAAGSSPSGAAPSA